MVRLTQNTESNHAQATFSCGQPLSIIWYIQTSRRITVYQYPLTWCCAGLTLTCRRFSINIQTDYLEADERRLMRSHAAIIAPPVIKKAARMIDSRGDSSPRASKAAVDKSGAR